MDIHLKSNNMIKENQWNVCGNGFTLNLKHMETPTNIIGYQKINTSHLKQLILLNPILCGGGGGPEGPPPVQKLLEYINRVSDPIYILLTLMICQLRFI